MKKKFTLLLWFALPLFSMAQQLQVQYEYDAAGNRTVRKTITMKSTETPPDSTETRALSPDEKASIVSPMSQGVPTYIEQIAQVAIKIYPNPTTEKITLEIPDWQDLQTGNFKLFSLTGQLLQEQPVHSVTTIISLAGLPSGVYILKVGINNRVEDWKVIKQ